MFQTLELRWFGERSLEAADQEWFESLGGDDFRRHEERTDRYVSLPGVDDMGIKFRGDAGVDFKARTEEIGIVELRLSDSVTAGGQVESWAKWSYPGTEYVALHGELSRLDVRDVAKRRWQYLYALPEDSSEGASMIDLVADPYPNFERGMALELGEIEAAGFRVWTLAIEAFPSGPDLGSDMLSAALPALRTCPLELRIGNSMGYPAWLSLLGAS